MKRILYASGGFLTDDAIADALMEYASVLAIVNSADVVTCDGVDEKGDVREYQLLVGPASQIMAVATDHDPVDMRVDEAVGDFRERARRRLPSSVDVGDAGGRAAETDADATSHEGG